MGRAKLLSIIIVILLIYFSLSQFIHQLFLNPTLSNEVVRKSEEYYTLLSNINQYKISDDDKSIEFPNFCFVIQATRSQGLDGTIFDLLFQISTFFKAKYYIELVVNENQDFPELLDVIKKLKDERISLHTYQIMEDFNAPQYHANVLRSIDNAIYSCPGNTDWILLNDGSTVYDVRVWSVLENLPLTRSFDLFLRSQKDSKGREALLDLTPDIMSFDFYSRNMNLRDVPCERFSTSPTRTAQPSLVDGYVTKICKQNDLYSCQPELTANAFNWQRFTRERRFFSTLMGVEPRTSSARILEALVNSGWRVERPAKHQCLLSFSHNPQMCVVNGGVWDDSRYDSDFPGGRCLSLNEALSYLDDDVDNSLEILDIRFAHDANSIVMQSIGGMNGSVSMFLRQTDLAEDRVENSDRLPHSESIISIESVTEMDRISCDVQGNIMHGRRCLTYPSATIRRPDPNGSNLSQRRLPVVREEGEASEESEGMRRTTSTTSTTTTTMMAMAHQNSGGDGDSGDAGDDKMDRREERRGRTNVLGRKGTTKDTGQSKAIKDTGQSGETWEDDLVSGIKTQNDVPDMVAVVYPKELDGQFVVMGLTNKLIGQCIRRRFKYPFRTTLPKEC